MPAALLVALVAASMTEPAGAVTTVEARVAPRPSRDAALDWQPLRVFDSASGLPQNSVLALARDAAGYMFAGTVLGLARYDGVDWRAIRLGDQDLSDAVGALALSDDGSLWVGTERRGLFRVNAGALVATAVPGSLGHGAMLHLLPLPAGEVFAAFRGGLLRCAASGCSAVPLLAGEVVRSTLLDGDGADAALWVGTEGRGLRRVEGILTDSPRWSAFALRREDGLPNSVVITLHRAAADATAPLWIGTGRGFARWDGRRLTTWSAANGLPSAMVWAFAHGVDVAGQPVLHVATRAGGLVEVAADDRWRLRGSAVGLPDPAVQSLFVDPARGTLWIGTVSGGLARVEPGRWATRDERSGLPDRNVVGVGIVREPGLSEQLWVGTAKGAVIWRDGAFVPLLPASHGDRRVHALADLSDGTRWVATERGVLVLDGARLRAEYTVDNSALPAVVALDLVRRVTADGSEEIWIGTGHGLARWRAEHGLTRWWHEDPTLRDAQVRALAVQPGTGGRGDTLWLAQGSALLADGPHGLREHTDCLGGAPVEDLAADADGAWLVTRDALIAVDAQACRALPMPAAAIGHTHVAVSAQAIHVFGARGAWRVPRDGGAVVHEDIADGLPAREPTRGATVVADGAGRVFVGTVAGLAAWAPVPIPPPSRAPTFVLYAHPERDPDQRLAAGARVPAGASDLVFGWRLLDFSREHRIRYRVELEGLDSAPRDWSAATTLALPRLPTGEYRFKVWARDADDREHGPATLPFAVVAPAWRQPWAYAAYAVTLLLAGAAIGRWRIRVLRRRAAALESEVALRTRELADANERLAAAAVTDSLTGLHNRHFLMLELAEETSRCLRRGAAGHVDGDLLLVLIDIDHFKTINDTHGHAAGDAVLIEVASRLRGVVREGDYAVRWGGEEFLLVLRDFDRRAAAALLPRLLAGIAGPVSLHDGRAIPVTVSAGAVAYPLDPLAPHAHGFQAVLEVADAALYRAKRAGRDQAVLVVATASDDPAAPRLADQVLRRSR